VAYPSTALRADSFGRLRMTRSFSRVLRAIFLYFGLDFSAKGHIIAAV
jgi:hypothetical protein